jgi:hypothetical protein
VIDIHAWTLIGPTVSPVAWSPINFLSCGPRHESQACTDDHETREQREPRRAMGG